MKLKIEELSLFPIKSCGRIETQELQVGEAGPQLAVGKSVIGDRQWMFVDPDGKFLTQRTFPKMARLLPRIENDHFLLKIGNQDFEIPLKDPNANRRRVSVWGKEVDAATVGGDLNAAASELLGKPVQLVRFDEFSDRESLLKGKGLGVQTRFTDSQQFLIVTRESLQDLNSKLQNKIEADRFRANIVLSGSPQAYDEDGWLALGNESVIFEATKPCARCKIITVDPMTGTIPNSEPLVVLSKFRKKETAVYFGQYFLSRSFGETLRPGDLFEISIS